MEYFYISKAKSEGNKPKQSDKRKASRHPVDLWVTELRQIVPETVWSQQLDCSRIINLSLDGAFISGLPKKLQAKIHEEIQFEFLLPNRLDPISGLGRVVRSQIMRDDALQSGIGVQFTQINEEVEKAIRSFLKMKPAGGDERVSNTVFGGDRQDSKSQRFLETRVPNRRPTRKPPKR